MVIGGGLNVDVISLLLWLRGWWEFTVLDEFERCQFAMIMHLYKMLVATASLSFWMQKLSILSVIYLSLLCTKKTHTGAVSQGLYRGCWP